MADQVQRTMQFDFSQDAEDFKVHLWQKLQAQLPSAMELLEDDDLGWVNTADMICRQKRYERLCC